MKMRFNRRLRLRLNRKFDLRLELRPKLGLRLKLRLRLCLKPRLRRALVKLQEQDRKGTSGQESSLSLQMPSFISGALRLRLPDEKMTFKTRKIGSAQLVICFSCLCFFIYFLCYLLRAILSGQRYLVLYATFDPHIGGLVDSFFCNLRTGCF